MKYCEQCGAEMNDDALFCSKCGSKVREVVSADETQIIETPVVNNPRRTKKPIAERELKEFLPYDLGMIGFTIILWIIDKTLNPTGFGRIGPYLIFMGILVFLAVTSMIRAIKTFKRKIYFKAALAFALFVLLAVCALISFIMLVNE